MENKIKHLNIHISPNFTNNTLQSYIKLACEDNIKYNVSLKNPIKILSQVNNSNLSNKYEDIQNFMSIENPNDQNGLNPIFIQINESFRIKELLNRIALFKSLTNEIYFVFKGLDKTNYSLKFKFFAETKYKIKIIYLETNEELIDFISNLLSNLPSKLEKIRSINYENKASIKLMTYFDSEFQDESIPLWIKQLICIPGISENKAHAIAMKHSFSDLMKFYFNTSENTKNKQTLLKNIEVFNKKSNKTTKIGEVLSKKVYSFFTSNSEDIIE